VTETVNDAGLSQFPPKMTSFSTSTVNHGSLKSIAPARDGEMNRNAAITVNTTNSWIPGRTRDRVTDQNRSSSIEVSPSRGGPTNHRVQHSRPENTHRAQRDGKHHLPDSHPLPPPGTAQGPNDPGLARSSHPDIRRTERRHRADSYAGRPWGYGNALNTSSPITAVPPTTRTLSGARRSSSCRVAAGIVSWVTRSTGLLTCPAAAAATRASGKFPP